MALIYKISLPFKANEYGHHSIELPQCVILTAREQDGDLCVWYMFEKDKPKLFKYTFEIVPTGREFTMTKDDNYIDTIIRDGFVWHIFYSKCEL